jgi:hypothetical protein
VASPTPPGFNAATVIAGLQKAMSFGAPETTGDQATFYMPRTSVVTDPKDDEGVPFDVTVRPTLSTLVKKVVPCAYEYVDAEGKIENFGMIAPARVQITLLDAEYQQVKGFEYVAIGGQRFMYRRTEPPVALGSINVWTLHCTAEDQA